MNYERPSSSAPRGYIDTRPYWLGLREHRLVLQQCQDTGRFQHYPRPTSMFTGSCNLGWKEVSGRSNLMAWTLVAAASSSDVPRVQALVDLEEGIRLLAILRPHEGQCLRVGQPLGLLWPGDGSSITGPIFAPVST